MFPTNFITNLTEINLRKYNNKIGNVIGNILFEKKILNESMTESFGSLLYVLNSVDCGLYLTGAVVSGICFIIRKLGNNYALSIKLMDIFTGCTPDEGT